MTGGSGRTGAGSRRTGRRARGSLSETEILDAALLLIERHGLDALSTPVLARELGAGNTSVYWYFRSKTELLEALVDRLADDLYRQLPELPAETGLEQVEQYYAALRAAVRGRPAFVELLAADPGMVTARTEAVGIAHGRIAQERAAFDTDHERAERLRSVCFNYTVGYVIVESGVQREAGAGPTDWQEPDPGLDRSEYRVLHDLSGPLAFLSIDEEQFEIGLRLLLRGAAMNPTPAPAEADRRSR
ncbi:MAG TPA: TetR/AcrR family transcriptional regulator [Mycobacteriales bacterium]|nr:TetR/AcrR family transcriptional regulator [Mycobacteriales bacterium]